jgi:hypothetical protein
MATYREYFAVLLLGYIVFAAEAHAGGPVQQQQQYPVQQQYQQTQDVQQRALSAAPSREASSTDGSKPYLNTFGYVLLAGFLGALGFVGYKFYPAWNQQTGSEPVESRAGFHPADTTSRAPGAAMLVPGSVFISYRRDDSADITGRIYDRLIEHFSRDIVFKDVDSIPLGIDFRQHLEKALSQCRVLIAVVGNEWMGSEEGKRRIDDPRDHVRLELELALSRNIPVIPVLVRRATIPTEEALPPSLRSLAYRNGIQVRPDPDFHGDVDRLIKGIEPHLSVLAAG